MIERKQLVAFAGRQQTTEDNIIREYFQHLFLSFLGRERGADHLLFKGGTALRVIWQSPRFSEDLDFTGTKATVPEIERLMEATLVNMEKEGVKTDLRESTKTSGGYLAIFRFATQDYASKIQIEISLRNDKKQAGEATLIRTDLVPPYMLVHLTERQLVAEKIQACLTRGKARDFYDFYFILRSRMAFQKTFAEDKSLKSKFLTALRKGNLDFKRELKQFLPVNQHMIIKNFPSALITEIERSLPGKK